MHRKMNLQLITNSFLSPLALMLGVLDTREIQECVLKRIDYIVDLQINPVRFLHLCTQCLPSNRFFL